ncbi:SRPBCC domain-containing protein [Phenylobacterium sp.]|uniref:SRPBCC domain-containing protein n=1 Tax=Phenylobacterium sp. TaxID=1871053 RepID=UPI00286A6AAF|nr:SRPBCC domain-containing protein [Phenylobacterium sp.]
MPISPSPQLKAGLFGRGGTPRAPKPTATGAPPAKPPSGVRIEHRIGIQAPAEVIWAVIADLAAWSDWNPLYSRATGDIRIGAGLDLTLNLPGQPPQRIRPVVLDWVPNEQLQWRLSLAGGLVRTVRYIEIEALAPTSCIVANGEYVGGLMGSSVARRVGRSILRGFTDMNAALKIRAEAQAQAERG